MLKKDSEIDPFMDVEENFEVKRFESYKTKDKETRSIPKCIKYQESITSLDFHPVVDYILSGLSGGDMYINDYSDVGETKMLKHLKLHESSCSKCQFTDNGENVFSVSQDQSIVLYNYHNDKIVYRIKNAHSTGIETGLQCQDDLFVSGDSDGVIHCWDFRKNNKKPVCSFKEHTSEITKFDYNEERKVLYSTSLDGRLGIFDLKKFKTIDLSGFALKSASYIDLCEVNYGGHIICATDSGCLDMFFYERWDRPAQRLTKHRTVQKFKPSFECLLFLKEELIAGAHSNGYIALYDVSKTNKIEHVGGLGRFNNVRILSMALASDGKFLATSDEENKIRFWHTSFIFDGTRWCDEISFFENEKKTKKRKRDMSEYGIDIETQKKKKTKFNSKPKRFFADLN